MNQSHRVNLRLKQTAIAFFSAVALSACFDSSNEVEVPLSEVPANIVSTVQNALPGITLTEAEKETKGETVVYELEGRLINGKEYEIEIAADGTIIKLKLED